MNKGLSFSEYINSLNMDEKRAFNKKSETVIFDECVEKEISEIKEQINIIVFSEGYCPDCAVVMPILGKMMEFSNKIEILILARKNNESLLKSLSGNCKIPTIIRMNPQGVPIEKFVEIPRRVRQLLSLNYNEAEIYSKYREGEYDKHIISDLLDLVKS